MNAPEPFLGWQQLIRTFREWMQPVTSTRGCSESSDPNKNPQACWNIRCQLSKNCCRSDSKVK